MKKILAVTCIAVAALAIVWSVGVASDFFASSTFSSFWWLSYQGAHYAEFAALAVGGAALMLGINFWFSKTDKKTRIPRSE